MNYIRPILGILILNLLNVELYAQNTDYDDLIGTLSHQASNGASIDFFDSFANEHIKINSVPVGNLGYFNLIDAYLQVVYNEDGSVSLQNPKESSVSDFKRKIATSFENDTINQIGYFYFLKHEFHQNNISESYFTDKLDSLKQTAFDSLLATKIRNVKFHYRLAKRIPDFEYFSVHNDVFKLSETKSDYILLDFWFKYCAPCLKSFPRLQLIQKNFNNIEVVSLDPMDNSESIVEFLKDKSYDWKFASIAVFRSERADANQEVNAYFNVGAMPRYVLLSKNLEILDYNIQLDDLERYMADFVKNR